MTRDHRKLRVFHKADELVFSVYEVTKVLPIEERFGLQSQIRRAAISIAANVVEGCARTTRAEYCRFLEIAHSSSREIAYLIDVASRMRLMDEDRGRQLVSDYAGLSAGLMLLIKGIRRVDSPAQGPEALDA